MSWIIALRVLFSVSANAVQKKLLMNHASIPFTWVATYAMMLVPAVALAWLNYKPLPAAFWTNIILGGVIDAVGNLAMVAALRTMDLSVFGPLNGLRPVLALLFGIIFFGEMPSAIGYAGIAVTVLGTFILVPRDRSKPIQLTVKFWKALFYRVAGLSLGVFGAVYLKKAAAVAPAEATVAGWLASGFVCLVFLNAVLWPKDMKSGIATFPRDRKWLIWHSVFFLAMQWLTIRIFQETLLAYSFVYFQLAMLLQVFAGKWFFDEPHFVRRLVAALVIALGSVLILWRG